MRRAAALAVRKLVLEYAGRQLDQWDALDSWLRNSRDRIERDVDVPKPLDDAFEVLLNSLLVESVDLSRLGDSAGGGNLLRN